MDLAITVLKKVKVEHELKLRMSEEMLERIPSKTYPNWILKKREKSENILKEVNEAIAVLSAYKTTRNETEKLINET